jgi:hypothetical protein
MLLCAAEIWIIPVNESCRIKEIKKQILMKFNTAKFRKFLRRATLIARLIFNCLSIAYDRSRNVNFKHPTKKPSKGSLQ